jgi:C-terminal processing protease CtpA/Prc
MKTSVAVLIVVAMTTSLPWAVAEDLSAPEKTFESLWKTFDRGYGNFVPKKIDWDLLYKVYRPRVTPATTDDELFAIMSEMLGHLNDNHVNLFQLRDAGIPKAKGFSMDRVKRKFNAGILNDLAMEDFSLDLVKEKYLKGKVETRAGGVFQFGFLKDSIGYFHFNRFRDRAGSGAAIDEIIRAFQDAKGLVVDVRGNGGGDDRVGKLLADRFADKKRLYMVTKDRNGPKHDDFGPP